MVLCYNYQINFFYINYMYSFGKVGRKGVSNFKLAWKLVSAISQITFFKRALKISGPIILKILSKYRMFHCQIYLYSLLYNITTKNWKNFKIIFLKRRIFLRFSCDLSNITYAHSLRKTQLINASLASLSCHNMTKCGRLQFKTSPWLKNVHFLQTPLPLDWWILQ